MGPAHMICAPFWMSWVSEAAGLASNMKPWPDRAQRDALNAALDGFARLIDESELVSRPRLNRSRDCAYTPCRRAGDDALDAARALVAGINEGEILAAMHNATTVVVAMIRAMNSSLGRGRMRFYAAINRGGVNSMPRISSHSNGLVSIGITMRR